VHVNADETILISHGSERLKAKSSAKPEKRMSDKQLICDSANHIRAYPFLAYQLNKVTVVTEQHFSRSVC
jgi:hypothetical protein